MRQTVLDHQLARVRSRWILRDTLWAVSRMIIAIVPVCLLAGWLDHRLSFSQPTRWIQLLAMTAGLVWATRRYVLSAVRQVRDAYTAALRVEATDPRFGGRLVSRVQFSQGDAAALDRKNTSPELIAAMCERVEQQTRAVEFRHAVELTTLRRPVALSAVLLLLAVSVVVARPQMVGLWLVRTLCPFSSAGWPQRTLINGISGEYRVRRGAALVISGRIAGEVPREGELEWHVRPETSSGNGTRKPLAPSSSDGSLSFDVQRDGSFSAKLGPLLDSVELVVTAGDARVSGVNVHVVTPPELASIELMYRYPEFTGRTPDRVQSGDVHALVGTQVELRLTADRPMQRAEINFELQPNSSTTQPTGAATQPERRSNETMPLSSPLQASTTFRLAGRGRYQIRLFDSYGFTGEAPATFIIDPIDNELPTVTISRPALEHAVTPATRLAIQFEATDDYGVTDAKICWRKRGKAAPASQPAARLLAVPVGEPLRKCSARYAWDLAGAGLQAGDEVEYFVQAGDAGEHLTPQKAGRSASHVLKVIDPESLRQSLEANLKQLLGELDHLVGQQTAGKNAVSMLVLAMPASRPSGSEVAQVQAEFNRQVNVRRQVERLSGRIAALSDELDESFLADGKRVAELRALATGLTSVAGQPMQHVLDELEQARSSITDAGDAKSDKER